MDFTAVLIAASLVGGVGLFVGLFLGTVGKFLAVEVNEKEAAVLEALPNNNCGGCGFASCSALAKEIAAGNAPANSCPVGGAPVAEQIADIMGVEAGEVIRLVAHVKCGGDCSSASSKAEYTGVNDCRYAALSPSGNGKDCIYGCLGLGSCVAVCTNNAIKIENGIAKVDYEECFGCGQCAAVCPKGVIEIVPLEKKVVVDCVSRDKLKDVKQVCSAGCLGCGVCAKLCKAGAIRMENNLPVIDASLCNHCGTCVAKCPTKALGFLGEEKAVPAPKNEGK